MNINLLSFERRFPMATLWDSYFFNQMEPWSLYWYDLIFLTIQNCTIFTICTVQFLCSYLYLYISHLVLDTDGDVAWRFYWSTVEWVACVGGRRPWTSCWAPQRGRGGGGRGCVLREWEDTNERARKSTGSGPKLKFTKLTHPKQIIELRNKNNIALYMEVQREAVFFKFFFFFFVSSGLK